MQPEGGWIKHCGCFDSSSVLADEFNEGRRLKIQNSYTHQRSTATINRLDNTMLRRAYDEIYYAIMVEMHKIFMLGYITTLS